MEIKGDCSELSFEVPLSSTAEEDDHQAESLQDAFAKFRKRKQEELKLAAQKTMLDRRDPIKMQTLRRRFLETAMHYIGTPYAKRYHPPDSPTHNEKLFLDCCGLVRQVLRDLKDEFGFLIGPWNQAYMFDTLPIAYSDPSKMEAGDLVFISGTYNNPKAKKQQHDIVHVEIWLGEGDKVVGARWQRGRVEVHESYRFEATSYHDMQYHFRSINTWLAGECRSYCPEHAWQVHKFDPSKRSIFAAEEEEGEEGVGEAAYDQLDTQELLTTELSSPEHQTLSSEAVGSPEQKAQNLKLGRTFVVCGSNGRSMVEEHLIAGGWVKTDHKVMYTLKWAEQKHSIDYKLFREGEQLVNHIPNIKLLTTKIGLLDSLSTYYRLQKPRLPLESYFPQTFRLDSIVERDKFIHSFRDDGREMWICKPTGANRGRGIFLVRDLQQVLTRLEQDQKCCKPTSRPVARIIQRYITNPLLLNGRKFDLRVYMLIVCCKQWLVLYRDGYARLCCTPYDASSDNLSVHLTNQYQQKKHPLYSEVQTVWDFKTLQECLTAEHGLPNDWVATTMTERIKTIMTICFKSVKHKLDRAVGFFELIGFDFMLDADFNVWLIEANFNPAMSRGCETLAKISQNVVGETLDIAIEAFDKMRKSRTLYPLNSLQNFRKLSV